MIESLNFEKHGGLIPAIIQDHRSRKVLMLGFMNEEAYRISLDSHLVTFFSRSRNRLWTKGESSGNFLHLVDLRTDCDKDTLLISAIPDGPVCHSGDDTCFREDNDTDCLFFDDLQRLIEQRKQNMPPDSYTTKLFTLGVNRIAQKVGEEAVETVIEATNGSNQRLVYEAADLIYHLAVLLAAKNLSLRDVAKELAARHRP
jgi:phosphoribosyl-ATP pyrophosphohydrolase/phosphoribosyl-AMP cyclohydrolase